MTLIEVLVSLLIVAFGLLGLAGLQTKLQLAEFESYQRAQALVLVSEMADRISANRAQAGSYVLASTVGTGDSQPASCTGPAGPSRDLCEWSNALKGAGEQKSTSKVGAMASALGCITRVQAPSAATGVCTPGIYRVAVAWQGTSHTSTPAVTCGQGSYGSDDAYRRALMTDVSVALLSCY